MGEERAEIRIKKPAGEVWGVIGDFGTLDWMPGVDTCELQGKDKRVIGMLGMRIVERQLSRDDANRTFTYGIVDGDMKPEVHEATITVDSEGPNSFVTWDVTTDDAVIDVMVSAYNRALVALKEKLEG